MERDEEDSQERRTGRSKVREGLVILLLLSSTLFLPFANAVQVTVNPRAVNPFGVQFKDVSGQVTPTSSELFSGIGVCADKPNPSTVLGIGCFNGTGNDTIVFYLHPFELQQLTYTFNVTTYANASATHVLDLRFATVQPAKIIGTTIATKSYNFATSIQDVTFNAASSDPAFTLVFFSAAQNLANAAVYGTAFFALIIVTLGLLFFASLADQSRALIENRKPFLTTKRAMVIGVVSIIGWGLLIVVAASTSGALSGLGI